MLFVIIGHDARDAKEKRPLHRPAHLAYLEPLSKAGKVPLAGPLTDGAAAVLLMSEEKAKALGLQPLAAFRSWSFIGVDPADQLLMGPALAMPKALDRAGLKLSDIDMSKSMKEFGANSLDIVEVVSCAMRELKVKVPRSELSKLTNVDGLVDLLHTSLQEKEKAVSPS